MSRSSQAFYEAQERAAEAYMEANPDADPEDAWEAVAKNVEHDIAWRDGDYADFRREQAREEGWAQ